MKKNLGLLFLTCIGVSSGSVLSRGKALLSPRSTAVVGPEKQASKGVDKDLVGKVLTGAYLIQGAAFMFAPAQQLNFYGMKDTTEVTEAFMSDVGSDLVATGIVAYRSLIEKRSINKSVGSAFLFLFGWTVITFLTDRQGSIGASLEPIYARLVLFSLGALTALTDQEYASKLAFANAYFRLINGIFTVFDPVKVGDTWGLRLAEQASEVCMMRELGFAITLCSTLMVTLLGGLDSIKSMGWSSMVSTAYFISQGFITKEWEKVGMPIRTNYVMLFLSLLAGFMLLK
jgi:hypothetical protein